MLIAISGTPGTGKTTTSRKLAEMLDANFIRIRDIIKEIPHRLDRKRDTFIVDVKDLQRLVKKKQRRGKNIVEGHLAHMLDADLVIILRANPAVLRKRLLAKGWKRTKVDENVKAEILDAATIEALELHGPRRVFEIDTSRLTPQRTAAAIEAVISKRPARYRAGKIDWTRKYRKFLIS